MAIRMNSSGNSDYIHIPTCNGTWGTQLTFCGWFSIVSGTGSDVCGLIGQTPISDPRDWNDILFIDTTNSFRYQMNIGNGTFDSSSNTYTDNTWFHIAAVVNGTYGAIYKNGVMIAERNTLSGSIPATAQGVFIGNYYSTSRRLNGSTCDVRVYNVGLSAANVLAIYNGLGQDTVTTGLLARWLCNEKATGESVGTVAGSILDYTGNGYVGNPYGTMTYVDNPPGWTAPSEEETTIFSKITGLDDQ